MKSSQKLLDTQMDEAEHGVVVQPSLPSKDLCKHSRVHRGVSDIDATLSQVRFVEDQVSFLQLLEGQFCQRQNDLGVLWSLVRMCLSSVVIFHTLLSEQNQQEVEVCGAAGCSGG